LKAVYRWFGFALMLTASVFFIYYCIENWVSIPKHLLDLEVLSRLVAASFFYIFTFIFTAIAWQIMLNALGENSRLSQLLTIILISQFAKYIPGNIGHHLGRVVMAKNIGLASGPIILTMALEAGGAILAAISIGFIAFTVGDSIQISSVLEILGSDKIVILILFGAAVLLILLWLFTNYSDKPLLRLIRNWRVHFPGFGPLSACYLLYSVNYLLLGAILYFLVSFPSVGSEGHFWLLTGVFAVSWIAGYVTPGAPGGLGIREAIMVLMLDPVLGTGVALSLALVLRIVTTAGDAIGLLGGLVLRQWVK
jgi:uncharacterized membrane protein YbhN (UPF0104 family)